MPIHWLRHILGIVRNVVNTTSNFELSVSGACATGPFGRVGVVIPKMDQVKPDARGARKPIHCGSRNTVSGACAHVRVRDKEGCRLLKVGWMTVNGDGTHWTLGAAVNGPSFGECGSWTRSEMDPHWRVGQSNQ